MPISLLACVILVIWACLLIEQLLSEAAVVIACMKVNFFNFESLSATSEGSLIAYFCLY